MAIVNLFALCAPDPRTLQDATDPTGPANDDAIAEAARESGAVVLGWGVWGARFAGRVQDVRAVLEPYHLRLFSLGHTRSGQPRHPLYLSAETSLRGAWGRPSCVRPREARR